MTDHNRQSEQDLQHLYAKRKLQHLAPLSIKKNVLLKQKNTDTKPIMQRITYIATAACTLLLFAVFSIHKMQTTNPVTYNNVVHVHSLKPEPTQISSVRDEINNRYAKHYQDYLVQQQTFALHHKKLAALELVDNGWQLKTCDDEVMLLSTELIAALAQINQLDLNLASGDIVDIAFDSSGIILAIKQSDGPMLCS